MEKDVTDPGVARIFIWEIAFDTEVSLNTCFQEGRQLQSPFACDPIHRLMVVLKQTTTNSNSWLLDTRHLVQLLPWARDHDMQTTAAEYRQSTWQGTCSEMVSFTFRLLGHTWLGDLVSYNATAVWVCKAHCSGTCW